MLDEPLPPHARERTSVQLGRATEGEAQRVLGWRIERARSFGVPDPLAQSFAGSGADLHVLDDLIRKGCEPQLAVRIVV